MDGIREAETGEAVPCAASLEGFAPTGTRTPAGARRGRSVSRTRRAENAQFWAGNRQGDGANPKSPMSARRGPTCCWSPSPTTRSTTGRFLRSSGPMNGRLTFSCMRASQRGFRPSRATGTKSTMLFCATTSTASTKLSGRYLRDKATTEPELNVLARGVFPQAQASNALPRASRPVAVAQASSANKILVNQRMKRVGMRWSGRLERPYPQSVDKVGPPRTSMVTRAANEDQVPDAAWR